MLDDLQLIKRTLSKDTAAFQMLVERYKDYAYTICYSIVKNVEEAEEATQDTFVKVYSSLSKYESKSKFSTWLYTIAYRTSIDKYRRMKKHYKIEDISENTFSISDKTPFENEEIGRYLNQAIDSLEEEDALIIRMFYMEEMGIKEIHEITEISESNIKIKLFRARKKLKNILEQIFPNATEPATLLYKN